MPHLLFDSAWIHRMMEPTDDVPDSWMTPEFQGPHDTDLPFLSGIPVPQDTKTLFYTACCIRESLEMDGSIRATLQKFEPEQKGKLISPLPYFFCGFDSPVLMIGKAKFVHYSPVSQF
jgi:hypothetical protein